MTSRGAAVRILLLLGSFVVGWLAAESVARAILGPPGSAGPSAILLSEAPWRTSGRSLYYHSDRTVRLVAVVGGRIEYDVTFPTNDAGSIDSSDYGTRDTAARLRSWAIVGDSFTAGFHGGQPWIPQLRERVAARGQAVDIYNLGVGGTGFNHFLPSLRRAERELGFGHSAVLFVTDDLSRPWWRPVVANRRIHFCAGFMTERECVKRGSTILVLEDPEAGPDAVLEQVRRNIPVRAASDWLGRLARFSHLAAWLDRPSPPAADDFVFAVDLPVWLGKLAHWANGREVVFLHLPERHEVARGRYDVDVGPFMTAAGFRYVPLLSDCNFARSHYLADGHLGREGNEELVNCVGSALGLL